MNSWCTDTIDFYGPDTTRTVPGAQFYKARVWNPYYNAVGDTVHGPLSDRTRMTDGTWSAATQIDSNPSIGSVAAAALPDGTLHVQTVVPGSGVWDRTRSASGTWSSAAKIDSNGSVSAVSAAALPNGTLHVQTLVPGSGVWDRTRSASGTWSSATKIADGCDGTSTSDPCVTAISAAALPNGTLHVQTLTPGRGVSDLTRSGSGTWSALSLIDANGSITRVSAAALPDGTLHVQTVVPDHGLWDRTLSTSGTWSSATKLDADTAIFDEYGAGLPDGTLHVGSTSYAT